MIDAATAAHDAAIHPNIANTCVGHDGEVHCNTAHDEPIQQWDKVATELDTTPAAAATQVEAADPARVQPGNLERLTAPAAMQFYAEI